MSAKAMIIAEVVTVLLGYWFIMENFQLVGRIIYDIGGVLK